MSVLLFFVLLLLLSFFFFFFCASVCIICVCIGVVSFWFIINFVFICLVEGWRGGGVGG